MPSCPSRALRTQQLSARATAGLLCNTFAPHAVDAVRPVLPVLSLVDTCCCVGASLTGAAAARSPIAAQVLLPVRAPCLT